ncbi:hypothetical protein TI39_contig387g00003 [Zymoseptoria brevis]|uniref:Uncharacterized protein n=1 Tax=Zymoseptoria brevis TaxID=1047168 RepID=A0A0F4GN24_9PEZI|nr:hypothetical protein TI39_contig387g00003 [Zymoseptoria brevis]
MPAPAVAKGIIISLSIIAALGVAVAENPQIQAWLEEQRRKIVELLRQIGDELDPQSRRAAEAFAYEGRTVANDDGLRNEAAASQQAAALATGRRLSSPSTIRRIPIKGPSDPDEAEERRRKGRQYLAQRNQQMYELQQRRRAGRAEGDATPRSSSFDSLVDSTGRLRTPDLEERKELPALPSPPTNEPVSEAVRAEMKEVERNLSQPILNDAPSSSGWQLGSAFANPFGDEFEMERSITPKPPVPPKVALEHIPDPDISVPDDVASIVTEDLTSIEPRPEPETVDHANMSYEEQLAMALSLSEQDSPSHAAGRQHPRSAEEHEHVQAAIAASLQDQEARSATAVSQPLVDLSPSTPVVSPQRSEWEKMFDSTHSKDKSRVLPAQSEASDELYRITPQLTRARLAEFETHDQTFKSGPSQLPFDPVRDAARSKPQATQGNMDASFYSAFDEVSPTVDRDSAQLVDVSDAMQDGMKTPTTQDHSSFGFQTDSDTETFASVSQPASRAPSRPRSEISGIEVIDVVEDSDDDVLSEDGGVTTPDSWSEVGSRDAESDAEEAGVRQPVRLA